ncbi:MAG: carboxypeptidase-like regulatory domain-containing protein, partial [Candidatus Symbiothrix sp.]|nr:carboxypeptidase-like regulatory domain-containing protein [Candidatus Symbiothrix sp.]
MKNKFLKKRVAILVFGMFLCTVAFGQSVTKDFHQTSLSNVLKEIELQTGLSVVYETKDIDRNKPITQSFKNTPVEKVLTAVLDEKTNFTIREKMIMIYKKEVADQEKLKSGIYSGVVRDDNNEPVIGASVTIKGSKTGTVTDINGKFSIETVEGSTLAVSYIGYATKEVILKDKTDLQISLREDQKLLDEVVVIGYGTVRRGDLTGAISSVKGDDLPKTGNTTVAQMLKAQ